MKQKKAHFKNIQQIPAQLSCQSTKLMIQRFWVQTLLGQFWSGGFISSEMSFILCSRVITDRLRNTTEL